MKIQTSQKLSGISNYAFAEVDNEVAKLKAAGITPIDFGVLKRRRCCVPIPVKKKRNDWV